MEGLTYEQKELRMFQCHKLLEMCKKFLNPATIAKTLFRLAYLRVAPSQEQVQDQSNVHCFIVSYITSTHYLTPAHNQTPPHYQTSPHHKSDECDIIYYIIFPSTCGRGEYRVLMQTIGCK